MNNLCICAISFIAAFISIYTNNVYGSRLIYNGDLKVVEDTTFKSLNNFITNTSSYSVSQIDTTSNFIFTNFETSSVIGYSLINNKIKFHKYFGNIFNSRIQSIYLEYYSNSRVEFTKCFKYRNFIYNDSSKNIEYNIELIKKIGKNIYGFGYLQIVKSSDDGYYQNDLPIICLLDNNLDIINFYIIGNSSFHPIFRLPVNDINDELIISAVPKNLDSLTFFNRNYLGKIHFNVKSFDIMPIELKYPSSFQEPESNNYIPRISTFKLKNQICFNLPEYACFFNADGKIVFPLAITDLKTKNRNANPINSFNYSFNDLILKDNLIYFAQNESGNTYFYQYNINNSFMINLGKIKATSYRELLGIYKNKLYFTIINDQDQLEIDVLQK